MALSTQKAFILEEKLGNFSLGTALVPKPGRGEILIKIKTVALNTVDWKIQKYGILVEKYPAILGFDIAGDVEEVSEGVTEFQKGDRV
jgi:NADPH:quinone reductase-like Zn-dependent oxidoreductase